MEERDTQLDKLMEKLERQNEKKEELKQQLQEKDKELEDIKNAYRYLKLISVYTHIRMSYHAEMC